ncbi:MAG: DNA-directed RNA polymerase subunit omega [candidate division KSB1 bacterium]
MVSTVPLEDLEKHATNVYEAIIMVAKRARQINDDQKRYIEQEIGYDSSLEHSSSDDLDSEEENREERQTAPIKYIRLPKPTSISLDEMLTGKLTFHYAEEAEEDR